MHTETHSHPQHEGQLLEFDLIIIGGGSGNSIPGEFPNMSIAVIDDGRWFGGTCLNAGCIPTKMFVHPADVVEAIESGEPLGVHGQARADWNEVRNRVFGRIDAISAGGEEYRRRGEPNITLIRETVEFTEDHTLQTATGQLLTAPRILIGAGSRPRALGTLPSSPLVFTSDDALRLDANPARLAIIGGGVVASEFASIFHAFGSNVTQLVRTSPLSSFDADLVEAFVAQAGERWDLRTQTSVTLASISDDETTVLLELSDGSTLEVDGVLNATGRVPNTDRLQVDAVGFDLEADGRLVVDKFQRVLRDGEPVDGIFAFGDISNSHQLKHVANHEARVVARNVWAEFRDEQLEANTLSPVPVAVFSNPQIASFGHTLASAQEAGMDAVEARQQYGATAWGWALEDELNFCKVVADRATGQLLGAHIIGPDAAIMLQPLITIASLNLPVRGLARNQYWPHPAATEIVENALLNLEAELYR